MRLALALTVVIVAAACQGTDTAEEDGAAGEEYAQSTTEELTTLGVERVIPIRFVGMDDLRPPGSSPPPAPCPNQLTPQAAFDAVRKANEAFLAAGIQFTVAGVQTYNMPSFRTVDNTTQVSWSVGAGGLPSIQSQLALLDPAFSSYTPPQPTTTEEYWLHVAAATVKKNEIKVFVPCSDPQGLGGGHAAYPWYDGLCAPNAPWCGDWSHAVHLPVTGLSSLAHELGHFFGLRHTFSVLPAPGPPGNDYTSDPLHPDSDAFFYDHMYAVSGGAVTPFTSATHAQGFAQASWKMKDYATCGVQAADIATCDLTCTWNGQTFKTSTHPAAMAPIGITYKPGESYGLNLMSYLFGSGATCRAGISGTQIARVRETLRSPTGKRHLLGRYGSSLSPTTGGGPKTRKLDFDGDGKPDIAFWRPSEKRCYYVSSQTSTLQHIDLPSADPTLGDIPVPDDFDGDGYTDCAVYRPNTAAQAQWFWTTRVGGVPTCCQTDTYGTVGSVPLVGLRFRQSGVTSRNYGYYVPSTATFNVRMSASTGMTVQFGATGDQLMLADWDNDTFTDLAVWRLNGTSSVLSVAPSTTNTYFGALSITNLIFGNDTDVPLPAVDKDGNSWLDLGVYRPADGTWYYFLDPASLAPGTHVWSSFGAARRPSQQWGIATDYVLPGFNFDGPGSLPKTDEVVYRPATSTTAASAFHIRKSSGVTMSLGFGALGDLPFLSGDRDSDGYPELWVYRPNEGKWFEVPSAGGTYPAYYIRSNASSFEDEPL